MKRLIKIILMLLLIRWSINSFTGYRLVLPSGQRIIDCLGEIADSLSELLHEAYITPGRYQLRYTPIRFRY